MPVFAGWGGGTRVLLPGDTPDSPGGPDSSHGLPADRLTAPGQFMKQDR